MNGQPETRAWCEQQNSHDGAFAKSIWYFAIPDQQGQGGYLAARLDGLDAEEVRKAARGIFPDYAGWTPDKMRQHGGLVKYRLQMGMSESSFQAIVARWRQAGTGRDRQKQHAGAEL